MPTVTSMEFTGLQEFSNYTVTVTASFSEFGSALAVPSSMQFTTLSACTYMQYKTLCIIIIVKSSLVMQYMQPQLEFPPLTLPPLLPQVSW